jgi:hypothetical protein
MPTKKRQTKKTFPTPLQVAVADTLIECRAGPGTIRAFSRSQLVRLLDKLVGGRCTYDGDCVNIDTSGLNIFSEYLGDVCIDILFENLSDVNASANSLDEIREAVKSRFTVSAEFDCVLADCSDKDLKPRKKFVRVVLEPKEDG